jgi:hypothetical protein
VQDQRHERKASVKPSASVRHQLAEQASSEERMSVSCGCFSFTSTKQKQKQKQKQNKKYFFFVKQKQKKGTTVFCFV